ncbi:SCO family protein [Parapedobacter koreensis]|uniref:Protein SCO1/2 n=1 Tax=Parapedobacter koreensis TaxID=332977 RepID=A0A1H7I599_9SPHI|nr:SCO family protein [Parapedobacter koreensis]SEK56957.1 protein SCO1/2 [Parapedobacter koreensis]
MRIFFFLISGCLVSIMAGCNPETRTLPILGAREPVTKVVDGKTITDTVYHSIPEFQLLNQDSILITNHTFDNGVYIANFFFTHCPSICPIMQRNLLKVYEQYKGDERVRFLSHSIDFRYDSPSVLKRYAEKLGVTNDQWQFVTGSKAEIYGLADSYMVYTKEDSGVPGGYDHSGYFLLVDEDKHIRGVYDGTNDDQVQLLFDELAMLLKEYE